MIYRNIQQFKRGLLSPAVYVGCARLLYTFKKPLRNLIDYISVGGNYPRPLTIRTPHGEREVILNNVHSLIIANEVFCRRSYRKQKEGVVIDIGANIGLSALYFLTVCNAEYVYLYEPNPANLEQINGVLEGFENQYETHSNAVAKKSGRFRMGIEDSGVYGSLTVTEGQLVSWKRLQINKAILVDCLSINDVIEAALDKHDYISTIKLDIEGLEVRTVKSISPKYFSRIGRIIYESGFPKNPIPNHFSFIKRGFICELINLHAVEDGSNTRRD